MQKEMFGGRESSIKRKTALRVNNAAGASHAAVKEESERAVPVAVGEPRSAVALLTVASPMTRATRVSVR